jgi:hypothetical protein
VYTNSAARTRKILIPLAFTCSLDADSDGSLHKAGERILQIACKLRRMGIRVAITQSELDKLAQLHPELQRIVRARIQELKLEIVDDSAFQDKNLSDDTIESGIVEFASAKGWYILPVLPRVPAYLARKELILTLNDVDRLVNSEEETDNSNSDSENGNMRFWRRLSQFFSVFLPQTPQPPTPDHLPFAPTTPNTPTNFKSWWHHFLATTFPLLLILILIQQNWNPPGGGDGPGGGGSGGGDGPGGSGASGGGVPVRRPPLAGGDLGAEAAIPDPDPEPDAPANRVTNFIQRDGINPSRPESFTSSQPFRWVQFSQGFPQAPEALNPLPMTLLMDAGLIGTRPSFALSIHGLSVASDAVQHALSTLPSLPIDFRAVQALTPAGLTEEWEIAPISQRFDPITTPMTVTPGNPPTQSDPNPVNPVVRPVPVPAVESERLYMEDLEGNRVITIPGDRWVTIDGFVGVGRGSHPSIERLREVDMVQFSGPGLTAQTMILTQVGSDLVITFATTHSPTVTLKNLALEDLDNLTPETGGSFQVGNILFDGETQIQDSFDVINADAIITKVLKRNSVTFLNDLDNQVYGYDQSNDVINGQAGNDTLFGLGGNDILRGGAGDDLLYGGAGSNVLTGNQGSDTFVLSLDGFSQVTDFTPGQDYIGLSEGLSANQLKLELGTGVNSSSTWIKYGDQILLSLSGVRADQLSSDVFLPARNLFRG